MKIVFMGTPAFAAGILSAVAEWDQAEIAAVYTQPDSVSGRGKKLVAPETKVLAQGMGIPVFQPVSFKNAPDEVQRLKDIAPDVLVVAAYGMILPQEVLDIPPKGAWNVHASLLPRYRGAAPVQRCLINGEKITGVTIMCMEAGLDTGPILLQQAAAIRNSDDAGTLLAELSESGGKIMRGALGMISEGRVTLVPQDDALSCYSPKLTKDEAVIDWNDAAERIFGHVRGFNPNPGATAKLLIPGRDPLQVRIEAGMTAEKEGVFGKPGEILGIRDGMLIVACGEGTYGIGKLRPAGKNSMDAKAFGNGYLRSEGTAFQADRR